jgi:hypothetical protein
VNFRDDAWFSGFTAGEGCFLIVTRNRSRLAPIFALCLRADDLDVLEQLQGSFGGRLCLKTPQRNDNPAAHWQIAKKSELAQLVRYFDRFPLHAKKARDYTIWRRAVEAYCAHGSHAPELRHLREALSAGRKYAAEEPEVESFPQEPFPLMLVS